jgi:hypothetical protein
MKKGFDNTLRKILIAGGAVSEVVAAYSLTCAKLPPQHNFYGLLAYTAPVIYVGAEFLATGITNESYPIATFVYKNLKNLSCHLLETGTSIKKRALSKLESLSLALYSPQLSR